MARLVTRDCNVSNEQEPYLLLRIGPPGDLDNHVQHRLLLIGIQRDIVERRARHAILLNIDAVLEGMGSANFARGEPGRHDCGGVCLLRCG